ncbi:MAG: transglycosylase family protein [Geodermatophilaceae bacterium]|nr:transglycosylase family protein [Geodermatophilaceae bacterium]
MSPARIIPARLSGPDSDRPARGRHRAPRSPFFGPGARRRAGRLSFVAAVATALPLLVVPATSANAATTSDWERLAVCESGGNWSINTGNGYYGGLQFSTSTWNAFGGQEFASRADLAHPQEQMVVANRTLREQGWGAWPSCSRSVGLSGGPTTGGPTELITAITDRYDRESAIRSRMGSLRGLEQGDASLRWQVYAGGRTYWSPSAGAHTLYGGILGKFLALGGAPSRGVPTTDETSAYDRGAYNDFAKGGSIYWSRSTSAHEVKNAIRTKWRVLGAERAAGYPTTDEVGTGDGAAYNDFNNKNSIYWTSRYGAHQVRGSIRTTWRSLGAGQSELGYPTSDEYSTPTGARSDFAGGYITWDRATNTNRVVLS